MEAKGSEIRVRYPMRLEFMPDLEPNQTWLFLFVCCVGGILAMLVFRYLVLRNVANFLGSRYLRSKRITKKFDSMFFELVMYSVTTILGPWVIRNDACSLRHPQMCDPIPGTGFYDTSAMDMGHFVFYIMEASCYGSLLVSLFFEAKKKDYYVMLGHHVVTLTLMYFAALTNSMNWALYLLIIHNPSDAFLMWAKFFNYFDKLGGSNFVSAKNATYLFFLLSWIYYRIWLLPFGIVAIWGSITRDWCFQSMKPVLWGALGGPWVLYAMHWYWLYLIIRVIYKGMFKRAGRFDDDRSETETETDDADGEWDATEEVRSSSAPIAAKSRRQAGVPSIHARGKTE